MDPNENANVDVPQAMNVKKRCYAIGCIMPRETVYPVPKNQKMLSKWQKKMGTVLNEGDTICAKHFSSKSFYKKTLHKVKPVLKLTAVPSPDEPNSDQMEKNLQLKSSSKTTLMYTDLHSNESRRTAEKPTNKNNKQLHETFIKKHNYQMPTFPLVNQIQSGAISLQLKSSSDTTRTYTMNNSNELCRTAEEPTYKKNNGLDEISIANYQMPIFSENNQLQQEGVINLSLKSSSNTTQMYTDVHSNESCRTAEEPSRKNNEPLYETFIEKLNYQMPTCPVVNQLQQPTPAPDFVREVNDNTLINALENLNSTQNKLYDYCEPFDPQSWFLRKRSSDTTLLQEKENNISTEAINEKNDLVFAESKKRRSNTYNNPCICTDKPPVKNPALNQKPKRQYIKKNQNKTSTEVIDPQANLTSTEKSKTTLKNTNNLCETVDETSNKESDSVKHTKTKHTKKKTSNEVIDHQANLTSIKKSKHSLNNIIQLCEQSLEQLSQQMHNFIQKQNEKKETVTEVMDPQVPSTFTDNPRCTVNNTNDLCKSINEPSNKKTDIIKRTKKQKKTKTTSTEVSKPQVSSISTTNLASTTNNSNQLRESVGEPPNIVPDIIQHTKKQTKKNQIQNDANDSQVMTRSTVNTDEPLRKLSVFIKLVNQDQKMEVKEDLSDFNTQMITDDTDSNEVISRSSEENPEYLTSDGEIIEKDDESETQIGTNILVLDKKPGTLSEVHPQHPTSEIYNTNSMIKCRHDVYASSALNLSNVANIFDRDNVPVIQAPHPSTSTSHRSDFARNKIGNGSPILNSRLMATSTTQSNSMNTSNPTYTKYDARNFFEELNRTMNLDDASLMPALPQEIDRTNGQIENGSQAINSHTISTSTLNQSYSINTVNPSRDTTLIPDSTQNLNRKKQQNESKSHITNPNVMPTLTVNRSNQLNTLDPSYSSSPVNHQYLPVPPFVLNSKLIQSGNISEVINSHLIPTSTDKSSERRSHIKFSNVMPTLNVNQSSFISASSQAIHRENIQIENGTQAINPCRLSVPTINQFLINTLIPILDATVVQNFFDDLNRTNNQNATGSENINLHGTATSTLNQTYANGIPSQIDEQVLEWPSTTLSNVIDLRATNIENNAIVDQTLTTPNTWETIPLAEQPSTSSSSRQDVNDGDIMCTFFDLIFKNLSSIKLPMDWCANTEYVLNRRKIKFTKLTPLRYHLTMYKSEKQVIINSDSSIFILFNYKEIPLISVGLNIHDFTSVASLIRALVKIDAIKCCQGVISSTNINNQINVADIRQCIEHPQQWWHKKCSLLIRDMDCDVCGWCRSI